MSYEIQVDSSSISVEENEVQSLNLVHINDNIYHLIEGDKSHMVTLINQNNKFLTLDIDGELFNVSIADENDQLVKNMGLTVVANQKLSSIKAPMPGLILDVMIEAGQSITKGDALLILEAMKMENVLKADGDGIVKSIEINKGDTVEKGQLLVEME